MSSPRLENAAGESGGLQTAQQQGTLEEECKASQMSGASRIGAPRWGAQQLGNRIPRHRAPHQSLPPFAFATPQMQHDGVALRLGDSLVGIAPRLIASHKPAAFGTARPIGRATPDPFADRRARASFRLARSHKLTSSCASVDRSTSGFSSHFNISYVAGRLNWQHFT